VRDNSAADHNKQLPLKTIFNKNPKLFLMNKWLWLLFLLLPYTSSFAQQDENRRPKVEHAEPVFEDLTGELGARRGEQELNLNFGYYNRRNNHHSLVSMVEYEFVPWDWVGFEIVLPYSLYFNNEVSQVPRPNNQLEFFQWASQVTLHVDEERGLSFALGFRNIFEMASPERTEAEFDLQFISYYTFMMVGKNWRDKYFLLLSGGPKLEQELDPMEWELNYLVNTAFHYGFGQKDHYLGVEFNKRIEEGIEMYIRPQVSLKLGERLRLGIAGGVAVGMEDENWTIFTRFAYDF